MAGSLCVHCHIEIDEERPVTKLNGSPCCAVCFFMYVAVTNSLYFRRVQAEIEDDARRRRDAMGLEN